MTRQGPGFIDALVSKPGKVTIEFLVLKDGKIDVDGVTIQTSSGDVTLDRAARGSIIRSDPLPPLPREFLGQKLRLRFFFLYNLSPDIGVSPCVDVRVPVGSTLLFSASGKGITNTSVKWRVLGFGCSESAACGTISDTGLYTAPLNIPIPPVVSIGATPRSGNGLEAQSRVTVVQANPSR
jgi:TonB family protein